MSLFHVVHAEMIHDLEQGYGSWLRQTNRERDTWQDDLLEDNNNTRMYFLECVGFIKKPKRSILERLADMLR
jgi:hypothetical protein